MRYEGINGKKNIHRIKMEEEQILSELNKLFSLVFKNSNITLSYNTTAADVHGWDSLTHMILIDRIEKHFAIKFKLMEVVKFNNIGDIVSCIKKKLSN